MARSSAASAPQHGQRSAPCSLPSTWPPTAPTPPLHRPYTAPTPHRSAPPPRRAAEGKLAPSSVLAGACPKPPQWPTHRHLADGHRCGLHTLSSLLPAYHGTYQATPPCTASRPTRCSPSDSTRSSACARSLSSPSSPPSPAGSATRSAERGDVKSRVGVRGRSTLLRFFSIYLMTDGAPRERAERHAETATRPGRRSQDTPPPAPRGRASPRRLLPVPRWVGTQKRVRQSTFFTVYTPLVINPSSALGFIRR